MPQCIPYGTAAMLVAVAGCARPADRIVTALEGYGLDRAHSECVGSRLQLTLSRGQLRQLGSAARSLSSARARPLTVNDLVGAAAHVDDSQVPIEVAKAAVGCGLMAPAS